MGFMAHVDCQLRYSTMSFEKATEMTDKSSSDDVQVLTYKAGEQVSEGKVLAKIDFRVLSALMMLYILAFLDR